ncbi:hypothetical protein B296_00054856 [Ensete ventricosum]|uniref:Uncharacterized protein n=1 Tax=Ensete ventricosum TaxID=4639 RepID=A0A426WWA3_ENSVE|nr:hypothetical protein B296_00054856 [Ensete ventricosum]
MVQTIVLYLPQLVHSMAHQSAPLAAPLQTELPAAPNRGILLDVEPPQPQVTEACATSPTPTPARSQSRSYNPVPTEPDFDTLSTDNVDSIFVESISDSTKFRRKSSNQERRLGKALKAVPHSLPRYRSRPHLQHPHRAPREGLPGGGKNDMAHDDLVVTSSLPRITRPSTWSTRREKLVGRRYGGASGRATDPAQLRPNPQRSYGRPDTGKADTLTCGRMHHRKDDGRGGGVR